MGNLGPGGLQERLRLFNGLSVQVGLDSHSPRVRLYLGHVEDVGDGLSGLQFRSGESLLNFDLS